MAFSYNNQFYHDKLLYNSKNRTFLCKKPVLSFGQSEKIFNLPYRYAILDINIDNNVYNVQSKNSLSLKVRIKDKQIKNDLSNWIVERYCLYNIVDEKVSRGDVLHPIWNLKEAEVINIDDQFSKQFNLDVSPTQYHCFYSKEINVRFRPFVYNI